MSYKHNIIKERFDLQIVNQNQVTKGSWELDSNADIVYGVGISSDNEKALYYRGSQKLQVNDQELFPEDFESKLLMTGLSVPPNQRVIKVGLIQAGNGRVEVWYKDLDHPLAPFAPYTVSFYFFSKTEV